jgi:uncharacterized protein YaaQ
MKLVLAIVREQDAGRAVDELIANGFGATRMSTAGGFLKRGNATIMTGVEDTRAHDVIQILRDTCQVSPSESDKTTGAGVLFVLPMAASFKV